MQILPINNIKNNKQQNFKAKFSAKDINAVLEEINAFDAALYPKLYTMLERVNELPGKAAKFVPSEHNNFWQVHVDNKSLTGCHQFINRFAALYSSVVNHKGTIVKQSDIVRMPESIFEQKWWTNRFKGEEDVKNFSLSI